MKLIIAIVQDEQTPKVVKSLMSNKYRTTKLSSTGGFLKSGNTTLLIGVENEEVNDVIDLIKEECTSKKIKNGNKEVTVGGANIFVMDIDQHKKI
jgi:uncharacterized protein YaaQ